MGGRDEIEVRHGIALDLDDQGHLIGGEAAPKTVEVLGNEVEVPLSIDDSKSQCLFIDELPQILVDGSGVWVVYYIESFLTEELHQLIFRVIHQSIDGEVIGL